jgi:8-oxo-dGTP diphosphatase
LKEEWGKPVHEVAAGVIRKDGRLLVAKRRKGAHLEGTWEFPGGKREEGESLSECLKRELLEELGIKVSVGPRFDPVVHDYSRKRIVLYAFLCTWLKGEPKPLECQAFRWITPSDLGTLPLPPPDARILEKLTNSHVFKEWMKGKDMFYKNNSRGYNTPVKGIKFKSLSHGEKTHMCEFLLDAGSAIPEHRHPHEQTGYLVRGKLAFWVDGETFDADSGDSWSIPENVPHSVKVLEDSVVVEVFSPVREEYL